MPLQHSPKGLSASENDISTPASTKQQASGSTLNITHRNSKRIRMSDDEQEDSLESFKKDIKQMLGDVINQQNERLNTLEKHMTEIIEKNNQDIGTTLNFMSEQITGIQSQITRLENEKKSTSVEIQQLNDKIDILEKNMRKFNMNCATSHYLFKSLNIDTLYTEIKDVYRVPRKSDKNNTTMVIVELSSTLVKSKVLDAVKLFNKNNHTDQLNTTHLGLKTSKEPIFVSEHLSPKTKRIHYKARDLAKTDNYKFCWVSYGNVFLRKDENSPHILIKSEEFLTTLNKKENKA
ncbi:unnamed protein product [Plutella xylostella]|uniref:(diamondback moth) hypothetical protein n=1 Tax=Plutella xylostella TaxID=51655 RepID=A0A8S4GBW2_PLUXY|nr:unnamed protein product [Plutella xylostella]